ncbi:capsular polysaccharide synthesis protein [Ignatzschineria cameli]|uniref:capsular polysaccharide synthesis protein n=1 Tax=Ignatzschineria cameli TaxID=2182793 RepID=UPI000D61F27E|nr:capsular polysaccharide synthesis protein [Ignatzschineria cameli]PWD85340.1 capsular biosynthesis protein [Ignatzschineria cameli]
MNSNKYKKFDHPLYDINKKWIKRKLYQIITSKKERQALDRFLYTQHGLFLAQHCRTSIDLYKANKLIEYNINPLKRLPSKIIWQYWGQGIRNAPQIVEKCYKSIDKYRGDYLIIRLDDDSLKEYINIPDFILKKYQEQIIPQALFSDIIRLALLHAYGGIWIDSTMLLTDSMPENLLAVDFFAFQRTNDAIDKEKWEKFSFQYFGWNPSHTVNMLNSFMIAKKNNLIINRLLNLLINYWRDNNFVDFYFLFQVFFNELATREFYGKTGPIIDDTLPHLLQFNLDFPYSQAQFDKIKNRCFIHKLTHKKESIIPNSFYDYILNKNF